MEHNAEKIPGAVLESWNPDPSQAIWILPGNEEDEGYPFDSKRVREDTLRGIELTKQVIEKFPAELAELPERFRHEGLQIGTSELARLACRALKMRAPGIRLDASDFQPGEYTGSFSYYQFRTEQIHMTPALSGLSPEEQLFNAAYHVAHHLDCLGKADELGVPTAQIHNDLPEAFAAVLHLWLGLPLDGLASPIDRWYVGTQHGLWQEPDVENQDQVEWVHNFTRPMIEEGASRLPSRPETVSNCFNPRPSN